MVGPKIRPILLIITDNVNFVYGIFIPRIWGVKPLFEIFSLRREGRQTSGVVTN